MLNYLFTLFVAITDAGVAVGPAYESDYDYTGACPQGIDITSIYYDEPDEWIALTSSGKIIGNPERRNDSRMDIIPAELIFQSICGGLELGAGILEDSRVFWWDCTTSPPQTGFTGPGFTSISCGNKISIGLREDGSIEYIGASYAVQSQPELPSGEVFKQILAIRLWEEYFSNCEAPFFGLTTDGRVRIWGNQSDAVPVNDNTQTEWDTFGAFGQQQSYSCSSLDNTLSSITLVGVLSDGTTSVYPEGNNNPFASETNVTEITSFFGYDQLYAIAQLGDGTLRSATPYLPHDPDFPASSVIKVGQGVTRPGFVLERSSDQLVTTPQNYRSTYEGSDRTQTVLFSDGTYVIDAELLNTGEGSIEGTSIESTTVDLLSGSEGRPISISNCKVRLPNNFFSRSNIYLEDCLIESQGGTFSQAFDADEEVNSLFFANGCTFVGFESPVLTADGTSSFENCIFENPEIYKGNGTIKIVSCEIKGVLNGNACVIEAGGDVLDAASDFYVDCYSSNFSNLQGAFGTVFRCTDPVTGTLRNIRASNCESLFGGAIWLDDTKVKIENCIFDRNDALEGAAIYAQGDTQLRLSNCTFTSNTGSTPIRLAYSNALVADCFMGYNDGCWDLTSSLVQTQNSIYCENNPDFENPFVLDLGDNTVSNNCSDLDCNQNGIVDLEEIESGAELDCNQNNIPDSCDIDSGFESDCNSNQIPDSCDIGDGLLDDCDNDGNADLCTIQESPAQDSNNDGILDRCQCITDINGDGFTDFSDVLQVLSCWGDDLTDNCLSNDVTEDGRISFSDLIIMLSNFGPC